MWLGLLFLLLVVGPGEAADGDFDEPVLGGVTDNPVHSLHCLESVC